MQFDGWLKDTLIPFKKGLQSSNYNVVIFSADVDRTQSYVFESNRLPEIRGASRQVAQLGERNVILDHLRAISLPEECLLFAGGGSVMALLPTIDAAKALETRLARSFAAETTIVTLSCDYKAIPPLNPQLSVAPIGYSQSTRFSLLGTEEKHSRDFRQIVSLMAFQLRRQKQQKLVVPFTEILPFTQICESCHTRPAARVVRKQQDDERGDLVCDICDRKWQEGSRDNGRGYWLNKLAEVFKSYGVETNRMNYPQDIENIIDKETDKEAVALLYADGDGIGEKLQSLSTMDDYETFSNALVDSTYHAVCQTINSAGLTVQGKCNWEIITIGGDDILILIPASHALDFAIQLSKNFTGQMQKRKYSDTHMSVGFTVGKVKTPIRLLYEGARAALKNAKRRAKEVNEACIDWHNIIKEGHPGVDGQTPRTTQFSRSEFITGRPYSISDAAKLQASVTQIRGKGLNSLLYNIASELRQSAARGSLYYYYQRARLQSDRRKPLEDIEANWNKSSFPWISRENDQYTIFLDILDLL
jgi:hypothetical protein